MLISARIIKRPRKQRRCEDCKRFIDGQQVRLFGMAEAGDPPYVMYLHPGCAAADQQVSAKLKAQEGTINA